MRRPGGRVLQPSLDRFLARYQLQLVRKVPRRPDLRAIGRDLPSGAETMIGAERLRNLRECIESCLREGVPGDLIETGVWRGGATIFMRGVLAAHGDAERNVWVADSFAGLPAPEPERYPSDEGGTLHTRAQLSIPLEEVKRNFERYGLLDDRVRFLPGWFEETLASAPIGKLAILRLDGDMYSSTMQSLEALYPKLSRGGFAIVDDYAYAPCRQAVTDFRLEHGVHEPLREIDWTGVFWQRQAG